MAHVTLSTFKAAFKTLLEAEVALAAVTIHTAEETVDNLDRDHIVLGDAEATYEHYAMGGAMLESADVTCRINVHKVTSALALSTSEGYLEAVGVALNTDWSVGGTVLDCDLTSWSVEESAFAEQGRKCEIEFVVSYRQVG